MTSVKPRLVHTEGEYQLHSTSISDGNRTIYWLMSINPDVRAGVGKKITDIDAKTDEEAVEKAKSIIESIGRGVRAEIEEQPRKV